MKNLARNKIIIVDDEASIRFGIRDFLETHDYEVYEAENCSRAEAMFQACQPDAAIVDYRLPDGNALDLLTRFKAVDPAFPFIVLTAHGSIDLAVRAIKEGAEQFITKPVELATLLVIIQRILEVQRVRRRDQAEKTRDAQTEIDPFRGTSAAIRKLAEDANKVIFGESPILLQGETGTGKGVLARWLHKHGPRSEEPFVDINCATLSRELLESGLFGYEKGAFTGAVSSKPGLLEVGHRGVAFLDEIGDMAVEVQPMMLKVLEEKKFRRLGDVRDRQIDIRLIAATHQNLKALVETKQFRNDLYFRISTFPLMIPPLRERAEDIPLLAREILGRLPAKLGRKVAELSPDADLALKEYSWPGNVRELRHTLERAVVFSDVDVLTRGELRFDVLLSSPARANDTHLPLVEIEKRHIAQVLAAERGNVERAAAILGVPKSSLYQKINRFGIQISKV